MKPTNSYPFLKYLNVYVHFFILSPFQIILMRGRGLFKADVCPTGDSDARL